MDFDIFRLFEDETYISPGSIGGKIKKFRELKGWSQKESAASQHLQLMFE